jgi:hypothetical protein
MLVPANLTIAELRTGLANLLANFPALVLDPASSNTAYMNWFTAASVLFSKCKIL